MPASQGPIASALRHPSVGMPTLSRRRRATTSDAKRSSDRLRSSTAGAHDALHPYRDFTQNS